MADNSWMNKYANNARTPDQLNREYSHKSHMLPNTQNRVEQEAADPEVLIPEAEVSESGPVNFAFPKTLDSNGPDRGPYMQIHCYQYKRGYRDLNEIGTNQAKEKFYSIKLPLPPTLGQEYSADLENFNGSFVYDAAANMAGGDGVLSAAVGAGAAGIAQTIKTTAQRFIQGTGNMTLNNLLGSIGAQKNLASATAGININPRYEVAFNSMNLRTHSFDFNLVPANSEEAKTLYDMITRLKISAHPKSTDQTVRVGFFYPDEFVITFHDQFGERIGEIPTIPDCIIKDLGITHTTGRLHVDGAPVATRLTIQFQELQALDRDDIRRLEK
jgi:hypothetical protein